MAYDLDHTPADRRCVTAVFETRAAADTARADLLAAGVASSAVTLSAGASVAPPPETGRPESVLQSLLDIFVFMPSHDRVTFEEAMRRGGVALAVRTGPEHYELAIDILDRDGAIDLEEHVVAGEGAGHAETAVAPSRAAADPETAAFEASQGHDPLVNATANADVRERIGTCTSDVTVGTDLEPPSAASLGRRDTSHGRRRVRSYLSAPDGVDPEI